MNKKSLSELKNKVVALGKKEKSTQCRTTIKENLKPVTLVNISHLDPDVHHEAIKSGLFSGSVTAQNLSVKDEKFEPYFHEESPRYFAYIANGCAYVLKDFMQESNDTFQPIELTGSYDIYPIFTADQYQKYQPGEKCALLKNNHVMKEILDSEENVEYIYQVWEAFACKNPDLVKQISEFGTDGKRPKQLS